MIFLKQFFLLVVSFFIFQNVMANSGCVVSVASNHHVVLKSSNAHVSQINYLEQAEVESDLQTVDEDDKNDEFSQTFIVVGACLSPINYLISDFFNHSKLNYSSVNSIWQSVGRCVLYCSLRLDC